jgi:hypothetical protein
MYKQKEINNNISEHYCSFEVSKLLKDKGFDIWTYSGWTNGEIKNGFKVSIHETNRPTHALAIEWIRVNFGIWICIDNHTPILFEFSIRNLKDEFTPQSEGNFNSPQEATEAALLFTLQNLIK